MNHRPPRSIPFGLDPAVFGTLCGVVAAGFYTLANIGLRKLAVPNDPDWATWVAAVKAVPAAILAWIAIAHLHRQGRPSLPPARMFLPLVLTGLLMQFGGNVLLQWSLSLGGLALAVPLTLGTLIASGAVLGRIILGEPITPRSAVAMCLLIAAIAVLSLGAESATRATLADAPFALIAGSVLAACAAGVSYSAGGVMIRRTMNRDVSLPGTLVWISMTGVIALGLTSYLRLGPARLAATTGEELFWMLVAGVANAIAFFAVGKALHLISVVRVNAINSSQAALCSLAGVLLFGEPLTVWLGLGVLLTVVGLMLMERGRRDFANRNADLLRD